MASVRCFTRSPLSTLKDSIGAVLVAYAIIQKRCSNGTLDWNMAKRVEDQDNLTPQEAQACVYRAQGLDQTEAYRRAFDVGRQSQKTSTEKASRLFARGKVQARIQSLLDAAKVSDLLSAGAWLDQLKTDVATARAAGNHNAVMNGTRLLGQALEFVPNSGLPRADVWNRADSFRVALRSGRS